MVDDETTNSEVDNNSVTQTSSSMRKHLDYIYKRNLRTSRRDESGPVTIETDTKSQQFPIQMNQSHMHID